MRDGTAGCEHQWVPQLETAGEGLAIVEVCERCGAVAYEASAVDRPDMP